jgi:hypothetical protein
MGKLEVFDGKQTTWEGLWWHSECNYFSSAVISLAQLRKFKGNVRLYVKKNKFFNNGENGRPNYVFCLRDAKSDNVREWEIEDDEFERLYTESELQEAIEKAVEEAVEGMYTYSQVQQAIDGAALDGARGYGPGDNIVEDYI